MNGDQLARQQVIQWVEEGISRAEVNDEGGVWKYIVRDCAFFESVEVFWRGCGKLSGPLESWNRGPSVGLPQEPQRRRLEVLVRGPTQSPDGPQPIEGEEVGVHDSWREFRRKEKKLRKKGKREAKRRDAF